jgi:hypothetical protein
MKDLALDALACILFVVLVFAAMPAAGLWWAVRRPFQWAAVRLAERFGFGGSE